jgi:hypothetical protein
MIRRAHLLSLVVLAGCGSRGLTHDDAGADARGFAGAGFAGAGDGGPGGSASGGFTGSAGATGGFGVPQGGQAGGFITNPCFPMPTAVNCGAGMCGNGVRDTCVLRAAFDNCPEVTFTEVCDSAEVGAMTCRALGYGGGTPVCSNFCQTIDEAGCRECHDLDAQLLACGPLSLATRAHGVAMAATDSEVGLAWVEDDGAGQQTLGFARLSPNLVTLTSTRLRLDQGDSTTSVVSVIPLPSGWALVGLTQTVAEVEIFVQSFDPSGAHASRTTLRVLPDGVWNGPLVAERPDGGPMIAWATLTKLSAIILAADGRSATAPFDITTFDPEAAHMFDAAYVGSAFHVVDAVLPNERQLRLTRIETDGRVNATVSLLPGVNAYGGMLVRGAGDLRLIYSAPPAPGTDADETPQLQRVTATGAAMGAPVVLPGWPKDAVAFGGDTVVLMAGGGAFSTFTSFLARVANDGTVAMPFRPIASGGSVGTSPLWDIVRRGPDALVSWVTYDGSIQLARVAY